MSIDEKGLKAAREWMGELPATSDEDILRGAIEAYEAAKAPATEQRCQDEGCPHYGRDIHCEPKDGGCIATVPQQPDGITHGHLEELATEIRKAAYPTRAFTANESFKCARAAYEFFRPYLRPAEREVQLPVELSEDKGNWVDDDMVLAIAKHPDFLKMLYAFHNPDIEDNCVVPSQVAFFAVMALKPWLLKREYRELQKGACGGDPPPQGGNCGPIKMFDKPMREAGDLVTEALQRLVSLKDYKDAHGKDGFYEFEQPIAWCMAKEALEDEQGRRG